MRSGKIKRSVIRVPSENTVMPRDPYSELMRIKSKRQAKRSIHGDIIRHLEKETNLLEKLSRQESNIFQKLSENESRRTKSLIKH